MCDPVTNYFVPSKLEFGVVGCLFVVLDLLAWVGLDT